MARTIRAGAFISLDGVIQAPGGPTEDTQGGFDQGGWVFKLWDEGIEPTLGTLFSGDYDLLLGRRTYDIFAPTGPMPRARTSRWARRSTGPRNTC
jgi:hypothetical protein